MSEYPPIGPGSAKKGGLAGCIVAILVASGLIVALVVGTAIFVGWRLTREGPPAPAISLRDGGETLYLHTRIRPDDPGVVALGEKLLAALREAEAAHGNRPNPWMESNRAAGWRAWLPMEIDFARGTRTGGTPDAALVAAKFESMAGTARAIFRIAAFLAPNDAGSGFRRTEIDGFPVLLATPAGGTPGAGFAVALVGDRIVAARELADLRAGLTPAAEQADDEPAALAAVARLDDEDGWGYARPRGPADPGAIRLAVFSFDLVSDDAVRWRAALRGDQPPADRQASEQALVAALAGIALPEGLGLTLDRTTRWADDRTLVVEGTVDGIAGLLGASFKDAPETEPASPSPADPDKGPDPQT